MHNFLWHRDKVALSRPFFVDPALLLSDETLHELWPLLFIGFDAFVQQHFTNLRDGPLFLISDLLNVAPQFRIHSEY